MAQIFNFRDPAKNYVEGGFDHPLYEIYSRLVMPDGSQKYPLVWTILGVTTFCGVFWYAVIELAVKLG